MEAEQRSLQIKIIQSAQPIAHEDQLLDWGKADHPQNRLREPQKTQIHQSHLKKNWLTQRSHPQVRDGALPDQIQRAGMDDIWRYSW